MRQLTLNVPDGAKVTQTKAAVGEKVVEAKMSQEGRTTRVALEEPVVLEEGKSLTTTLRW